MSLHSCDVVAVDCLITGIVTGMEVDEEVVDTVEVVEVAVVEAPGSVPKKPVEPPA